MSGVRCSRSLTDRRSAHSHRARDLAVRVRCDAEGACRGGGDELVQVLWQFFQEQDEIPARAIVKKCDRRNQQGFCRRRSSYECGGRARDFGIQEAPLAAAQTECAPNTCLTQVDNGVQAEAHLKDRSDDSERTEGRVLPLTEVARELGERDPLVRGDIEGRITSPIPAVVAEPSSEAGIKYAERRIRGDMSNTDATPWTDVRVQRAQLGTPSYVEASSAKTLSMSPRSISCKAVRPPNTGNGVVMNCAKPSGV